MLFKSKTPSPKSPAVPDLAVQPEQPAKIVAQPARPVQHSVIPAGMQIDGNLMSAGDIIVGGMIQGDITCRTLTLEGDPIIGGSVRVRIPMKAASDSDGKAATHSDPKRPLFQRSELAGVIVAVG